MKKPSKRYIFLDCGANVGQSIDLFRNKYPYANKYEIYSFEPNPQCVKYFEHKNVEFFNTAVWIRNEELDFYLGDIQSSSICKNKTTGRLDVKHPIKVSGMDFSQFVIDNFCKDDYIVLKMDIEGAEYAVLNKMLTDGSMKYIDVLYVELHGNRCGYSKQEDDTLLMQLRGCKVKVREGVFAWNTIRNAIKRGMS